MFTVYLVVKNLMSFTNVRELFNFGLDGFLGDKKSHGSMQVWLQNFKVSLDFLALTFSLLKSSL